MRLGRIAVAAAIIASLVGVFTCTAASAHAEVIGASPGPCEVVAPTTTAELRFSQDLDDALSSAWVIGPDGNTVATGRVDLDDLERRRIVFDAFGPLPAGTYELGYEVTSGLDGDVTSAAYPFVVQADGAGAVVENCTLPGAGGGSSAITIVLVMASGLVVALVGLIGLRRRSDVAETVEV